MTKENAIRYSNDAPLFRFIAVMTSNCGGLKFVQSPKSKLVKVNGFRLFHDLPLKYTY
jgi:hypothetical protein